jgi:hypothetical protein
MEGEEWKGESREKHKDREKECRADRERWGQLG